MVHVEWFGTMLSEFMASALLVVAGKRHFRDSTIHGN
jgi:hypothetical protein